MQLRIGRQARHLAALSTLLAALVGFARTTRAEPALAPPNKMSLRVLTFNVWGLPVVTPDRAARVRAIGPEIARLAPDLVALEEVWLEEDAAELTRALAAQGLVHVRRFDSKRFGGSGLLIASRYPIRQSTFASYSQGGHPHQPWHLDWIANKGVGRVRVETPIGVIDFAGTHLQSAYGGNDYTFVQISQALEAADVLDILRKRRDEGVQPPLILAGDVNSPWNGLPFRVLAARLRLELTDERSGIDTVLYRAGDMIDVRSIGVRSVLGDEVLLENGERRQLSDHTGVLAEIELERHDGLGVREAGAQAWFRLAGDTLPLVRAELDERHTKILRDRWIGFLLLQLALALFVMRRRLNALVRTRAGTVFASILFAVALWFLYLGISYGPAHLAGLERIQSRLSAALVASSSAERAVLPSAPTPSAGHRGLLGSARSRP